MDKLLNPSKCMDNDQSHNTTCLDPFLLLHVQISSAKSTNTIQSSIKKYLDGLYSNPSSRGHAVKVITSIFNRSLIRKGNKIFVGIQLSSAQLPRRSNTCLMAHAWLNKTHHSHPWAMLII